MGFKLSLVHPDGRQIQFTLPHYLYCYEIAQHFDFYFHAVQNDGKSVDFSAPRQHTLPDGLRWWFPTLPEFQDELDLYVAKYRPKPGDRVLDAGAYAGLSTAFFSQLVGPAGSVVALEPDPINYEYLLRNCKDLANVTILPLALLDHDRGTQFRSQGNMGSGIGANIGKEITVPSITIPQLETRYGKFDFMKLDIEGAENRVAPWLRAPAVIELHNTSFVPPVNVKTGTTIFSHITYLYLEAP